MTEPPERAALARYRQLLAARGFRPSKARGQNFLLDPSLHRWIADTAAIDPGDLVLEVGAGLGFLTRELATRAARVVAVEIDARLAAILAEEIEGWGETGGRVRLVQLDALRRGAWNPALLAILAEERAVLAAPGRLLLVANLPYSASGPLLAGAPVVQEPPVRGAVLLQLEMAERVCAAPGTATYGALSALVQAAYAVRLARRVGPDVFWPRPRVGSAVVALALRRDARWTELDLGARVGFARFVRGLFGQRRKQLANTLPAALLQAGCHRPFAPPADLAARRPESLSADELLDLWTRASSSP